MKKLMFILLLTGCDQSWLALDNLKAEIDDCKKFKDEVDKRHLVKGYVVITDKNILARLQRCREIGAIE